MRKSLKLVMVGFACCLLTIGVGVSLEIYAQNQISNTVSSSTYLMPPISLTMVGGLPSQALAGENYTFHIIVQNVGNYAYELQLACSISNDYIYLPTPFYNTTIVNPGGPMIPFNYTTLNPDMLTIIVNGTRLSLSYDNSTNSLIGYTSAFKAPVGFYGDFTVAVAFTNNATTSTNYNFNAWAIQS